MLAMEAMEKVIDTRFERVEKALAALIDSIAKYNPSITNANDLAHADQELSDGLLQVQQHQNNHLRIQQLRAASASLDGQIRATLTVLASTRKDMTTTATTVFPDRSANPISFDELLSYARRISKTTLPPAGVTNGVDLDSITGDATPGDGAAAAQDAAAGGASSSVAQTPTAVPMSTAATPMSTNGAVTPTPATPAAAIKQDPLAAAAAATAASVQGVQPTTGALSVPDNYSAWMNPHAGALFFPWPHDDRVRMGSLTANQSLLERGIDPRGHDPAEEERRQREAAAEAKRAEEDRAERERLALAERERALREEAERRRAQREREAREAFRRGSLMLDGGAGAAAAAAAAAAGQPLSASPATKQQFQFMGDDDDDDDSQSD